MKNIILIIIAVLCFNLNTIEAVEEAVDYPAGFVGYDKLQGLVYRGNLNRDGVFQASGVPKAKGIKWEFKTKGEVISSPIVADGILYIGSNDKNLYAIDSETGTKVWSYKTDGHVVSTPAILGGSVFFISHKTAYSLDAKTGKLNWSSKLDKSTSFGSVAIAYGIVFCPAGGSRAEFNETSWGGKSMKGFDVITGKLVWTQNGTGPQGLSSPVINGTKMIYTTGFQSVLIDLETGTNVLVKAHKRSRGKKAKGLKQKWIGARSGWSSATLTPPVLSNGFVFDTGIYGADQHGLPLNGELKVTNFKTGKAHWLIHPYEGTNEKVRAEFNKDGKDHSIHTAPTVFGDYVFLADSAGDVRALNYKTKKRGWKLEAGAGVKSSLSYANGLLYFGCNDGNLYAVDAQKGTLVWKQECGTKFVSSPYIADGVIYIGSEDGSIYAIH